MVLDFYCISFIVYHLLYGNLLIYFINIIVIIIIITITLYHNNYYHYYLIYFFLYLRNITGCHQPHGLRFGGIHISALTLSFFFYIYCKMWWDETK